MVFDWREYLTLAQFLHGRAGVSYSEEAAKRAAVSRAYYAAFCHARNYANRNLEFPIEKKAQDHENLRIYYGVYEKMRPNLDGVADNLDELRQWRNSCDYEDEIRVMFTDLGSLVESALDDAQEIIDILEGD